VDAGTRPSPDSILELWRAFYNKKNLGGACGEIRPILGSNGRKLLYPLVATQNFEYKISNILDKTLETGFGYVRVLPSTFCAYRYKALLGKPLDRYFCGDPTLSLHSSEKMNIFEKNMFLTEDRILCFELVTKRGASWTLAYVRAAKAETDVPEHVHELVSQRRRWFNDTFAADVYSLIHFLQLLQTNHNVIRKSFFLIQSLFNFFLVVFSWFNLANAWLTFEVIIDLAALQRPIFHGATQTFNDGIFLFLRTSANVVIKCLYVGLLVLQFLLALGNRPKATKWWYFISFTIFGLIQ
jgi:chitin synthase